VMILLKNHLRTMICLTCCPPPCRSSFLSASKSFVEKDLEVSVAGRVFMITGANSGIGKATAMAIAKKGTPPLQPAAFQNKIQRCSFIHRYVPQVERSTWCAGTRTRPRRRGPTSSRRRETKYSVTRSKRTFNKTRCDDKKTDDLQIC